MTGMTPLDAIDDDEDDELERITAARCRKILVSQRKHLQQLKMPQNLPLFSNIDMLAKLLDLTEADQVVLTFAAGLTIFPEFSKAIAPQSVKTSTASFCRLLTNLTGIKEQELQRSLSHDGPFVTTGLVKVNRRNCDLEDKVSLMPGLEDVILVPHKNVDNLVACFIRKAPAPSLTLANFPHLHKDRTILLSYLGNALAEKTKGVNVLLHGKPGVGKNEFVQALAKVLNVDLYEVSYSDKDGDPIKGEARLRAYALCQHVLARNPNAMLLFDEIEDVFDSGGNALSFLFGDNSDEPEYAKSSGKAWINRTLENNPVPAVWISNRVNQIDKAYLRRFDYSVNFPSRQ